MADKTIEVTVTLTEDQVDTINALLANSRQGSFEAVVQQCLDFGIDNKSYRQGYNKKKTQEAKQEKAELGLLRKKLEELELRAKAAGILQAAQAAGQAKVDQLKK